MKKKKTPRLPQLLDRKIYKSGQTRGADDDEIYQNRVGRNSTVLIRFDIWKNLLFKEVGKAPSFFENGFIVLITPAEYFGFDEAKEMLAGYGLTLGLNCLIFYQRRQEWDTFNPAVHGLSPANSRKEPLGGQYVARIHATTALENGSRIAEGFTTTGMKGAGIRVYEYAPKDRINACRCQLEAVYWLCENSIEAVCDYGMSLSDAKERKAFALDKAAELGLLDYEKLYAARIINAERLAMCPLCLDPLDANGFFNRKAQAEGREKFDLTITELNLFHIEELRPGLFNHRPYNLGWGHHLCNVVIGDEGIDQTVKWMHDVAQRNINYYHMEF